MSTKRKLSNAKVIALMQVLEGIDLAGARAMLKHINENDEKSHTFTGEWALGLSAIDLRFLLQIAASEAEDLHRELHTDDVMERSETTKRIKRELAAESKILSYAKNIKAVYAAAWSGIAAAAVGGAAGAAETAYTAIPSAAHTRASALLPLDAMSFPVSMKKAIDELVELLLSKRHTIVIVGGPRRTGKTYTLSAALNQIIEQKSGECVFVDANPLRSSVDGFTDPPETLLTAGSGAADATLNKAAIAEYKATFYAADQKSETDPAGLSWAVTPLFVADLFRLPLRKMILTQSNPDTRAARLKQFDTVARSHSIFHADFHTLVGYLTSIIGTAINKPTPFILAIDEIDAALTFVVSTGSPKPERFILAEVIKAVHGRLRAAGLMLVVTGTDVIDSHVSVRGNAEKGMVVHEPTEAFSLADRISRSEMVELYMRSKNAKVNTNANPSSSSSSIAAATAVEDPILAEDQLLTELRLVLSDEQMSINDVGGYPGYCHLLAKEGAQKLVERITFRIAGECQAVARISVDCRAGPLSVWQLRRSLLSLCTSADVSDQRDAIKLLADRSILHCLQHFRVVSGYSSWYSLRSELFATVFASVFLSKITARGFNANVTPEDKLVFYFGTCCNNRAIGQVDDEACFHGAVANRKVFGIKPDRKMVELEIVDGQAHERGAVLKPNVLYANRPDGDYAGLVGDTLGFDDCVMVDFNIWFFDNQLTVFDTGAVYKKMAVFEKELLSVANQFVSQVEVSTTKVATRTTETYAYADGALRYVTSITYTGKSRVDGKRIAGSIYYNFRSWSVSDFSIYERYPFVQFVPPNLLQQTYTEPVWTAAVSNPVIQRARCLMHEPNDANQRAFNAGQYDTLWTTVTVSAMPDCCFQFLAPPGAMKRAILKFIERELVARATANSHKQNDQKKAEAKAMKAMMDSKEWAWLHHTPHAASADDTDTSAATTAARAPATRRQVAALVAHGGAANPMEAAGALGFGAIAAPPSPPPPPLAAVVAPAPVLAPVAVSASPQSPTAAITATRRSFITPGSSFSPNSSISAIATDSKLTIFVQPSDRTERFIRF